MIGDVSSADAWAELLTPMSCTAGLDDGHLCDLVRLLNKRGEPEVVEWAVPLLADRDSWRRTIAALVLAQHGFQRGRPFGSLVMPGLVAAARVEQLDETRAVMVEAIGDAEDPSWVDELLRYVNDPFPDVRQAVAAHLPLIFAGENMNDSAIAALIKLSSDPDPHVRDWATTGLGTQTEQDSPALRTALRNRLDDTDDDECDTSSEAALGLALRGDPSVYPYLVRWLDQPTSHVGSLIVEAAGALGDRRLLPALWKLHEAGWHDIPVNPLTLTNAIVALEVNRPGESGDLLV